MRYVHFQVLFPALVARLCSSPATWYRLPFRQVSNCRPTGEASDEYFMISLSLTIRLISAIKSELTHTVSHEFLIMKRVEV